MKHQHGHDVAELLQAVLETLAHELRAPLNAMLGWSELLLRGDLDAGQTRRGLEAIARNARAQAHLIDALLDKTKLAAIPTDAPKEALDAAIRAAVAAVRPPDAPPAATSTMAEPTVSLAGVRVLVVDDEHDAREILRNVLESAGAAVVTAGGAEEAVTTIRRERPDVLVSDIGMPGRDGYHLLRVIRTLPPEEGGRTPAIAVTAFARVEDRTRALLAGYQVHIAKPVLPHELIVTVASAAGRTGPTS